MHYASVLTFNIVRETFSAKISIIFLVFSVDFFGAREFRYFIILYYSSSDEDRELCLKCERVSLRRDSDDVINSYSPNART